MLIYRKISDRGIVMKKILCVILSFILVIPFAVFASAAGNEEDATVNDVVIEKVETDTPVIVVRGMNFTGGLQFDRGTENAKAVQPEFDAAELFNYLTKTFAAVVSEFSIEAGVSVICEYVTKLFGSYPCDENGNSLHTNITAASFPEACSNYPEYFVASATDEISLVASLMARYGGDMVYYFDYDWRLDPMDNADLLDSLVQTALSDHNTDKADFICCSMGGSIMAAYMAEYGYSNIDTIVSNTSVIFGTDVITDLFQGNVCFDADAVERYISAMVPSIAGFVKVLSFTGVLDGLCNFINSFAKKYEAKIYEETLVPTFATLPGFWSMCKADEYATCREFIFGGREEQYKGLLERLDNFHYNVAAKRTELIDGAIESGVNFCVLASYGSPMVPAYERAKYQSDGVVETAPMSGGAVVSVVGHELTEEQLAAGDSRYVSADKCINASTCAYRDYTWFIKDSGHVIGGYGSDCVNFIFALLESEEQPTVNTWNKYPQFMQSSAAEILIPLE